MTENSLQAFRGKLAVYSVAHFCVDFACGCLITSRFWPFADGILAVILYNFFAFAGQMPIGILADRWNRNALVSTIGCGLVAAGVLVATFNIPMVLLAAAVIAGIGNAMFHMGGGIDVLNVSGKKISSSPAIFCAISYTFPDVTQLSHWAFTSAELLM